MRTRVGAIIGAAALCLLRSAPAAAVHFVKVDGQIGKGLTPQAAQSAADPCHFDLFQDANGDTDGRSAFVLTRSSSKTSFVDASCSIDIAFFEFAQVIYSLQPDPGEVLGAPVALCFQAEHDISAQSTAGFTTASQRFGGAPSTDPASITRNATTIYSAGPTTVMNGSDADHAGGGFSANIGDQIQLEVGTDGRLLGSGVASASTNGFNRLYVSIGPCAGAPAVSHGGLGLLAIGLAAFAVLRLRRRAPS